MTPMAPLIDLQREQQARMLDDARHRGAEDALRRELDLARRQLAERDSATHPSAQKASPPFGFDLTPPTMAHNSFPSPPTFSPGNVHAPTPHTTGAPTPRFRDDLQAPLSHYREQGVYQPRADPVAFRTPQPAPLHYEEEDYDQPLFASPMLDRSQSQSAPSSRRRAPSPMSGW